MPSRQKTAAPAARTSHTKVARPSDAPQGPQPGADVEGDLSLPHERDQGSHMTDGVPSQRVRQASNDVERGLQDTSKGDEMDRAYQKQR